MEKVLNGTKTLIATLGVCLVLLFAPSAYADALDDARAAGLVGEQRNGYLGLVSGGVSSEVQRLVQDINLRRKDSYRSIVDATPGATLSAVEALAGQKLIAKTPAGQYVQSPSGGWVRK